jgi:hypothetical protein
MHHCPPSFTHAHRLLLGHGHPFGLDHPLWSKNTKTSPDRTQRSGSKVTFRVQHRSYTGRAGSRPAVLH